MQKDSTSAPLQLAQANTDPGFKVPGNGARPAGAPADQPGLSTTPPPAGAAAPGSASSTAAASAPMEIVPAEGAPATDTSARELAIGGGVFVVLMTIFFVARNAYTHHLVVRRVAPSAAGSAGWLLFVGLSFVSAAAVLAIINASRFLNLAITGTLVLVGILSLAGALLVGRR
ncbi:MAG TPA: hypothetical protein VGP06_06520 [Janthinobacterium sp.]|nr:hypothetical protein [Janthinobacterium sp.]